jgi:hypothetical protein
MREDESNFEQELERQRERETETIKFVAELGKNWQAAHSQRAHHIETEILKEAPRAQSDERLLVELIGHDFALCEILGQAEVQLAKRISTLVDNTKVTLALAKALRETSACRGAAEGRVQQLMQTRAVLHGQRRLAQQFPSLRRVA